MKSLPFHNRFPAQQWGLEARVTDRAHALIEQRTTLPPRSPLPGHQSAAKVGSPSAAFFSTQTITFPGKKGIPGLGDGLPGRTLAVQA